MAAGARPLDELRPAIPIGQVDQLLLGARRRGLPVAPLLQQAGIPPAWLAAPLAQVTQAQFARLTLLLRHRLRDELWGLCRRPLPPGSYAQSLQLMVRCATLGEALTLALRHYRLLLPDITPRLRLEGTVATLSFTPRVKPDPALDHALRTLAFLGHGTVCWLIGRRLPLLAANTPPSLVPGHAHRLFQAPVLSLPGWTGWRFEARHLSLPVVQTPAGAAALLRHAPAGLLLRYRERDDTTEQVRRILRRHLAQETCTLADVSAEIGLTPQTLRRHLAREGQRFRALRDALRRDAAMALLARPQLALAEVARQLGFSEVSTFHRAFRGWTGQAPGRFRLACVEAPVAGDPIDTK